MDSLSLRINRREFRVEVEKHNERSYEGDWYTLYNGNISEVENGVELFWDDPVSADWFESPEEALVAACEVVIDAIYEEIRGA